MVGKVYDPPGINRTPPREREGGTSKPSPATTLCATPVKDPEPVVVPRFKSRPDVGAFKPSPAPAPTHLASGQAVASIVNPTSSTALNPALKPVPKPVSKPMANPMAKPPARNAALANGTGKGVFADGENLPRLPVQQAIFRFALEQSRRIDDTAGYMKMSEVLGLVSKATRKIVQPSVELYHALDNDDLSRLLRLQKKGFIQYSESTVLRADVTLPAVGLGKLPDWVKHIDLAHASYRPTAQNQQSRYFWEMLSDLKKRPVSLETLVLPHCVAYLDAAQEFLDRGLRFEQAEGQGFETLRKLVVPGERVPGGLPSSLLRCCSALDTLVIEHFDDDSDLTAVGALGNLKRLELKFRGSYAAPIDLLMGKLGVMAGVEEFDGGTIDLAYLLPSLERHFPRLRSFTCGEDFMTPQVIPEGIRLDNNKHVSAVTWLDAQVPKATLDMLDTLPSLETLRTPNFPVFPPQVSQIQEWADHQIFGKIKTLELAWVRMNDATMAALRARLPQCEFVGLLGDLSRYAKPVHANTAT
jgi:hypothetical protein